VKRGTLALAVGLLAVCALLGFASGFAIASSSVEADSATPAQTTEPPPPTTVPPPTDTVPPPPPPPPPAPKPPPSALIEPGVIVGQQTVGWLTPRTASDLVRKAFSRPLVLVVSPTQRIRVAPQQLGAHAKIEKAIRRARSARPGVEIPLEVEISRAKLRRFVQGLAKRYDRQSVDAGVVLKGIRPRVIESVDGRRLKVPRTGLTLRIALSTHMRDPIPLEFGIQKAEIRTVKAGPAIVILRDSKRLLLYAKEKMVRRFGIATGQSSYPTPTGDYEITTMQRNPWWYPPPSGWAADSDPVPPGPGNPLGTRWMGISAPYVGIHGTPDAASIGYSASHGCIRMRISDAEWLFQRVEVGTPVFILPR
jgi:lipoprotein-anchoring transpeptidase ErfK/SrfK